MVVLTDLRVAKGKQNFIEIHCANFPRMLQLERKLVSHFLSSSINISSFCSRQYIYEAGNARSIKDTAESDTVPILVKLTF